MRDSEVPVDRNRGCKKGGGKISVPEGVGLGVDPDFKTLGEPVAVYQ